MGTLRPRRATAAKHAYFEMKLPQHSMNIAHSLPIHPLVSHRSAQDINNDDDPDGYVIAAQGVEVEIADARLARDSVRR